MKENVLDVLIYMFENAMFDDEAEAHAPDQEALAHELSQAGFEHGTIDRAFDWLENLAQLCEQSPATPPAKQDALRHYSAAESERIGLDAQGLLLNLEQCGVLDPVSREMVIDRLLALDDECIDLDNLKWVILMVLGNYAENDVSDLTEALVMDGLHTCIH